MNPQTAATPAQGVKRRWLYVVLILAFFFVLMPFLFWESTWFGRPLSDAQITQYLGDRAHPRKQQHALSQIADRMMSPDPALRASARGWYPRVVELASSPQDELRLTAAWVMGQDPSVPEFHQALLGLLADRNPMVQRNAALSLVRFQDSSGHDVIVAMLEPYDMPVSAGGKLSERLKPGDIINPGTLVGRIEQAKEKVELRTPVPGTIERWLVPDGSAVSAGQRVLEISPSPDEAWESLRALYLIGRKDDIATIDAFVRSSSDLPPNILQQASLTKDAIRARNP